MEIVEPKILEAKKKRWAESSRRWKEKYPERVGRAIKAKRAAVIALLGSVCVQCGFSDVRALQIDHVFGGGRKERLEKGWWNILTDILENGSQGRYQLLCANCNTIKRIVNKEHGDGGHS